MELGGGTDGRMDGRTDGRTDGQTDSPCVLEDFVPFGAAAQKEKEDDGNFRKRDRNNDVTMIKLQLYI